MNLPELDEVLAMSLMPVREETLVDAWEVTAEIDRPRHVIVLVTMHANPRMEEGLERAAREFVAATHRLPGALGSTFHRQAADPKTLFLLERFDGEESFAAHMTSDYFARFQLEQESLLAAPVQALFLER